MDRFAQPRGHATLPITQQSMPGLRTATEMALCVAGGFSMTKSLPLERYFRDARGGLFQPPREDLALMLVGRSTLAADRASR